MRQKRQRDSQAGRQGELLLLLLLCRGPPPPSPARTFRHSWPLRLPTTSGGPAFSMSPLLHSNLQHLSLRRSCFPSSLIFFDSSSFSSSSSSSFGSVSPRCPATVRVHHYHGDAGTTRGAGAAMRDYVQIHESRLPLPPFAPMSACHARCTQPHTGLAPQRHPPTSLPEIQRLSPWCCLHAVAL